STPAATVPLLACTCMDTSGTSGARSEMTRDTVEWGGTTMPLVLGGLNGPRLDQKLSATLAAASAGLTSRTWSEIPTRPSPPTNHQSVPGGRHVRSDRPRAIPPGMRELWLATTPAEPNPAAVTCTAPYGVDLCTTAAGLSASGTARMVLPTPKAGV